MNLDEEHEFEDLFDYVKDEASQTINPLTLAKVLNDCARERRLQDARFGDQSRHHLGGWHAILAEEFGEVAKEVCDLTFSKPGMDRKDIGQRLREELVQTMAVCAAFIESGDRHGWDNWPFESDLKHVGKDEV